VLQRPEGIGSLLTDASSYVINFILGGIVVFVLSVGPNFAGSNPADTDGFLRAIKFLGTTSFGREVKPPFPCRRMLVMLKNLAEYDSDTS
jgi:hypothetical protein